MSSSTSSTSSTSTVTGRSRSGALTAGRGRWFAADAAITGVNAVAYLAAAGLLADLMGASAETYRWVGLFLAGYALAVGLYARSTMPVRLGWVIVVGNAVWVAASLEVAATGAFDLDALGRGWVVAQAVVVAALAVLQARALRAR
ncbi:hypothetical protein [Nocardioides sp. SYSU DS0651]|uniref:hypothetical protein n=1 Tax=Nocardioides sp. SYSU DS0651 TaxID=3415955 RepID=UPI003F4BEA8B